MLRRGSGHAAGRLGGTVHWMNEAGVFPPAAGRAVRICTLPPCSHAPRVCLVMLQCGLLYVTGRALPRGRYWPLPAGLVRAWRGCAAAGLRFVYLPHPL